MMVVGNWDQQQRNCLPPMTESTLVKAFTIREKIWLAVEMFFHNPGDFKGVFHRAKAAMDHGFHSFATQIIDARRQEPEKQSSEALFTLL